MSHYLEKIKRFPQWEKAFKFIIENNTSSNLPYHNTRHCINVFNTAIDIADSIGDLIEGNVINLGLACLFHDINHSGGKLNDQENIQIAVKEFLRFYVSLSDRLTEPIKIPIVSELIQYTIFPRIGSPVFIIDQIIMDSDLIQCYDIDWFIFAIKGLADERGVSVSQAISDQINFINNVTYYTNYAQKLHEERKEEYLKELNNLKTLFLNNLYEK
jgi:hypothetical protein